MPFLQQERAAAKGSSRVSWSPTTRLKSASQRAVFEWPNWFPSRTNTVDAPFTHTTFVLWLGFWSRRVRIHLPARVHPRGCRLTHSLPSFLTWQSVSHSQSSLHGICPVQGASQVFSHTNRHEAEGLCAYTEVLSEAISGFIAGGV